MRVLVTGSSGFVGRWLVRALAGRGHEVWGYGRGPLLGPPEGLRDYRGGDLAADPALEAWLGSIRPEAVVHLAGQSSVGASWRDTAITVEASVVAAANLLLGLRRASAPVKVFVDVGSAEEYAPSGERLTEASPVGPVNPYGIAKLAQARVVGLLAQDANVALVHFRPFNHVGPGQARGFVIPDWIAQLLSAERTSGPAAIRVGNLGVVRDFTDVRDVVRAYVLAVEGQVPPGTYNLSSGVGRTLRSVLKDIVRAAGVEAEVVEDVGRLRPGDAPVRVGDSGRIREAAGWRPEIPWETTLGDAIAEIRRGDLGH